MFRIRHLLAVLLFTAGADAYVLQANFDPNGSVVILRWPDGRAAYRVESDSFPVPSSINGIVSSVVATWTQTPAASIDIVSDPASLNTIRYARTADGSIPQGVGVLALTRLETNGVGGIQTAAIVFNGAEFDFSFDGDHPDPDRIDFQDVLTHEIGHFAGLDHAPYLWPRSNRPTMTPFYLPDFPTSRRSLHQDDICGVSALYPNDRTHQLGSIRGRVTDDVGSRFGAHVIVLDADGSLVASVLTGQFTGPRGAGDYVIEALPPGDIRVRVEPLSGSLGAGDFTGIYRTDLDRNFAPVSFPAGEGLVLTLDEGKQLAGIDLTTSPHESEGNLVVEHPAPDPLAGATVRVAETSSTGILLLVHRPAGTEGYGITRLVRSGGGWEAELPGADTGVEYRVLTIAPHTRALVQPAMSEPPFTYEPDAFASDVIFVALRSSGEAVALDAGSGRVRARYPAGDLPTDILVDPSGRHLYITNPGPQGSGRVISVVDVESGALTDSILIDSGPLDLALDTRGSTAYVTLSTGRAIGVIDLLSGILLRSVTVPTGTTGPFGIALSPTDHALYLTDPALHRILEISPAELQFEVFIDSPSTPRSLAVSPDGASLYVAGFDGELGIIDTGTRLLTDTIPTGAASLFRLHHFHHRNRIYATDPIGSQLVRVDLGDRTVTLISTLPQTFDPRDVVPASNPDTLYISGGQDNTILVFDTDADRIVRSLPVEGGPRGLVVWTASSEQTAADFDRDGRVGFPDFLVFAQSFGTTDGAPGYDRRADLDRDGVIDFADFILFAQIFQG